MLHPTIATHAPTPAECERLDWLFLGGEMQAWYRLYAAYRGQCFADIALGVHIKQHEEQVANCRRWAKNSLFASMWEEIGDNFQRRLDALRAVRTPSAERAA